MTARSAARALSTTTVAVVGVGRALGSDGPVLRFSSAVHRAQSDGSSGGLRRNHGGQALDSGRVTGNLSSEDTIVVDADEISTSNALPLQVNSAAIILHNAREETALRVHADSNAIRGLGLLSASINSSHGNDDSRRRNSGDNATTVGSRDLLHSIVVAGTGSAIHLRRRNGNVVNRSGLADMASATGSVTVMLNLASSSVDWRGASIQVLDVDAVVINLASRGRGPRSRNGERLRAGSGQAGRSTRTRSTGDALGAMIITAVMVLIMMSPLLSIDDQKDHSNDGNNHQSNDQNISGRKFHLYYF